MSEGVLIAESLAPGEYITLLWGPAVTTEIHDESRDYIEDPEDRYSEEEVEDEDEDIINEEEDEGVVQE